MTDYAKLTLDVVLSESSDYTNPRAKLETTKAYTPTAHVHQKISVATTGNTFLDFIPYNFATVDLIVIHNTDTTNYVTAKWISLIHDTATITNPGSTGFTFSGSAGTITDNTSGSKFANVTVGDLVHNNNSTHSDNRDKLMLVKDKPSAHQITVVTSLTDSSNDTAVSFTIVRENHQRIGPGGTLTIPGNMLTDTLSASRNEMQLIADTAAVTCNLVFLGT